MSIEQLIRDFLNIWGLLNRLPPRWRMPVVMGVGGIIAVWIIPIVISNVVPRVPNLDILAHGVNFLLGAALIFGLSLVADSLKLRRLDNYQPEWADVDGNVWVRGYPTFSGSVETLVECGICRLRLGFQQLLGSYRPLQNYDNASTGKILCPGKSGTPHEVSWFSYAATYGDAQLMADAQIKGLIRQQHQL